MEVRGGCEKEEKSVAMRKFLEVVWISRFRVDSQNQKDKNFIGLT